MKKIVMYGLLVIMVVVGLITCSNSDDIEVTEYSVIFNLDGGNVSGNESAVIISVKQGKNIDNLPSPKKDHYLFDGWFLERNGKGKELTTTTIITSNVSVFAKWTLSNSGDNEVTEYTVIFNLDEGNISGNESAVIIFVKQGKNIDDLPSPKKDHYVFDGWFFEKNGNGNEFTTTTIITSNVSVFAKWTLIKYTSILKQLPDSRFNGVFIGNRDYTNINVHYELKLTFDGTNKIKWFSQLTENTITLEPHVSIYEIEVDNVNGKFRRRLWDNSFDDFTEWLPFEFVGTDILKIQWYDFLRQPDTYYKTDERAVTSRKISEIIVSNISDEEETYSMMKEEEKQLKGLLP